MSDTDALLTRRNSHLSSTLSLMYDPPLHIVRGQGQYLYDADGYQYLDCINNVPHVGHSHPKVTEAVCDQLAKLNTNTRFLYEPLLDYSEKLCALFPDPLSVCFFVNSGSEANELALRLAHAHNDRDGIVVLDHAYHGHTTSLTNISPYKFDDPGGRGRPSHVQVAPAPDPFRGKRRGNDSGPGYARDVDAALKAGTEHGYPPSAFIAEPLLGCAGQVCPPPGFLPSAFKAARDHGAIAIADEVQIGFGRVGSSFWAFDALGAQPDIVTLGKPIGNSYPLGAVVTTPEIARSFEAGPEYFNTFGGSPVACAAGLAVLNVLEEEGLQRHAHHVGEHLMAGFRNLGSQHSSVADVRGMGLFIGVELVSEQDGYTPAAALAEKVVTDLRHERILLSIEGPAANVLKIKPPLPFDAADADRVVGAVDQALGE